MTKTLTYKDSGVNIDAGNQLVSRIAPNIRRTQRPGADAVIGGFGGFFDLAACNFRDPILVSATDGVGTKLKIAIETGIHNTIGIDLVAMSVNDLLAQGAQPLFFLDYFACGFLNIEIAESVIAGIIAGCQQAGVALIGGETAEMPGIYNSSNYDIAGFAVGAVERTQVLPRNVAAGNIVVGLASSGIHSNGFSLVRHLVAQNNLSLLDSIAPFNKTMPLGQALLQPTRIYAQALMPAIATGKINAITHITGGGFWDNIPRVLPEGLSAAINLDSVPFAPVFQWLADVGQITQHEMLRTFNCGIGMMLFVEPDSVDSVLSILSQHEERACVIGEIIQLSQGSEKVICSGNLQYI